MTHEQRESAAPELDRTAHPAFEAAYQAAQKSLAEGGIPHRGRRWPGTAW